MKIITLNKEEFENFSEKHVNHTFYQTSLYANWQKELNGYQAHYLGFTDDNDNLIGASLLLYKTLFWGYKFAYAPRGFLIDYNDTNLIEELSLELKKLLKKQKFIFIKVDPPIIASERDTNGKVINFNKDINTILKSLFKNSYEHLGFNLYNETLLPRWNVLAKLNKDGRILYNNFSSDIKEKISYATNLAIAVKEDSNTDIMKFYELIKGKYTKKNKKYFKTMYDAFIPENKIKIFYAYLSTQNYTINANKLYAQEEEKNKSLAEIIQSGNSVKYNIPKAINDKIVSDRLLSKYKKDIVESTKLLKKYPDGIICGGALTIQDNNGVHILFNYQDSEYTRYNVSVLLNYEIMKYFGKQNYQYINLGEVTGNFDSSSKYYEKLQDKVGFNSSILEYIGELNLIINPTMYKIYKKKYDIKKFN